MESTFAENYAKLNKKQKQAVDTIDGPLLVIAGPGTGKTQLLSLRVANILDKTDAIEENILCLTFTETAVREMRERLNKIIGQSAYKITIETYHGFGSNLIRQYPSYFSNITNLQPAGDLLVDKILRDITTQLKFDSPFKNTAHLNELKSSISDFKKATLYPKDIREIVKSNLEFIANLSKQTKSMSAELSKVSNKSASSFAKLLGPKVTRKEHKFEPLSEVWNRELQTALNAVEEEASTKPLTSWKLKFMTKDGDNNFIPAGKDQNQRLLEFADIYEAYLNKMDSLGRYDYDDMILKSIEALKKHPDFKFTLQEQFQYVLLDEYQDTNEAQAEFVTLLTDNPVNESRPNVMAVGDDDQAIYSFQGASHSHMLNFYDRYKDVQLITLETNYRSNQEIIELSTGIANQIESRLTNQIQGINKVFKSALKDKGNIKRLSFVDSPSEYSWIAENISSPNQKYSNVAILAPRHKLLSDFAVYLQARNIPINYERREDVLSDHLINQIITIARLLIAIKDKHKNQIDSLLIEILNYDFWQIDTESIWQLSWRVNKTKSDWVSLMLKDKTFAQIALFLIKLSSDSLSNRFDMVLDQIIGLSEAKIKDKKASSFKSPFYEYYKSDQQLSLKTFSSLLIIRDEFLDYSEDSSGPLLISDFVDFIDSYKASEMKMLNTSPYIESEESVQLMTTYASKGREFDSVYLFSAIDEVWGPSSKHRSSYISLPPNLKYARNRALDNDDEKLRLIYVALSRAKNNLYISSAQYTNSSKPTTTLKYLNENELSPLMPKGSQKIISPTAKKANVNNLVQYFSSQYRPLQEKANLKQTIKKRLEDYQLNPSDLNTFLDVRNAGPIAFFNKVVLKYPSPDTSALIYGIAVHHALEYMQRYLINNNKLPTYPQLQSEFIMELKRKHMSTREFDDLAEKGNHALKIYYAENKNSLSKDDLSEVSFKHEGVVIGGAHLNGNIDKLVIDKTNKRLTIVDYKTGTPHKYWEKTVPLHINKNQLYFYKILVENSKSFKNSIVDSAYLDYTQPDSKGKLQRLPLIYEDEEMQRVEQLIAIVWKHISDLKFPEITKYSPDYKGVIAFEEDLVSGKI